MAEKWKLDFSGVEDKSFDIPNGDYKAQVVKVTKESGSGEYPYLLWELKILSGAPKGLSIRYFTSLSPKSLFVLRNFLSSLGIEVPKAAISLDPTRIIGLKCLIRVEEKPNKEGKMYPTVVKTFASADSGAVVEAATPPKGKKAPEITDDVELLLDIDDDDAPF